MSTRHIPHWVAGISLILLLGACGTTPSSSKDAARAKAASDNADALLADAVLRQRGQSDSMQALPLVKMAYDKAPERPDIAWLYAQLCASTGTCQPEAAEARLRRLDPKNAAAWLGALARADRDKDVAAQNEILDVMSRSERFDVYWNSLVSRIAVVMSTNTVAQVGPQTPDLVAGSLNEAVGWLSSVSLPAFRPLSDACVRNRSTNPALTVRCKTIADVLMRGDTYVAEGVGLGIRERLAPPGSPEANQVAADIERSRYQRETAGQIIASQEEQEKFSRELLELMSKLRREQDVYLAVLRWGQQPLEP